MEIKKIKSAKDAIRQAIEGGYLSDKIVEWEIKYTSGLWIYEKGERSGNFQSVNDVLLDPLFWQSLDKARGWATFKGGIDEWMLWARVWFQTRISGGSESDFWSSLP